MATTQRTWWKEASVYQIYPSSFKDSNGDGIGDIPGVISKIDYLVQLGIDIVWLGPIFKSPQVDMGYDIADYEDIHPPYGTLQDVEKLINALHGKGMKFIMDLVVNHTSDRHEWFIASKSSKDSPFRDWYFWRPPRYIDGVRHPPNNWGAYFGGSAWEYDEGTDEYYLHLFAVEQPDLNWDNPRVVEAVHKVLRFWLDKGVDGFRMDVINFISKVPELPDAPVEKDSVLPGYQHGGIHYAMGPRLHEHLQAIGAILSEYNGFSVGEMPFVKKESDVLDAVGFDRKELNMIFNFETVDMDHGPDGKFSPRAHPWKLSELQKITEKWQIFMYDNNGWNALYLENHDQSRSVSRYCSDLPTYREYAAKMLATFLGCQAGTIYIYQGQELGMINVPKEWGMEEYKDLESINHWKDMKELYAEDGEMLEVCKSEYQKKSRDNARTPMQWDGTENAGFTTGTPWMRVNSSYIDINAAVQVGLDSSPYTYWSKVLRMRKEHADLFIYGSFELLSMEGGEKVMAYERRFESKAAKVLCNWSTENSVVEMKIADWEVLLCNYAETKFGEKTIMLRPYEAVILLKIASV